MGQDLPVRSWRWVLLGVLFAGCTSDTDDPTTEPPSSTSSTAAPSTTSTTASTTTTLVPPSVPPGPGTTVVVSSQGVLGWWDGQAWVRYAAGEPVPVVGGERYQVVRLDDAIRATTGSALVRGCVEVSYDGNPAVELDLGPEPTWPSGLGPLAVSGVEDPRPRPVSLLDPAGYGDAADEVLADLEFEREGSEVVQAVRADLDGDGATEVIVVAERLPTPPTPLAPPTPGPGDHSVTFLRVARGDGVQTELLASEENLSTPDAPSPYLLSSRVAAVADLNGDGRMEIALAQHYYEGSSTVVFEVGDDGTATEVLSIGCGA